MNLFCISQAGWIRLGWIRFGSMPTSDTDQSTRTGSPGIDILPLNA